jgi:hypothetical protein
MIMHDMSFTYKYGICQLLFVSKILVSHHLSIHRLFAHSRLAFSGRYK